MKNFYWVNFESYYSQHYCYLISERIGNSPIIKITRQFGDLPFFQYFKMRLYFRIARWFNFRATVIEHDIKVVAGMDKDVVWKKRDDGMYEPYDKLCGISMPHLTRKEPPTKKRKAK